MGTADLLYRASFKGARFLPQGAITTDGGRKLIDHIYPNSSRRFIEDLGKKQRDFTITGIVQGPNYYAKRNLLISALEGSAGGRLVHPFFGSIFVKARPFSLVEDMTAINIGTFSMSFSIPSENIFPTNRGLSNIASFANSLREGLDELLSTDFSIDFSESILAAENMLTDVFDKFDDATRNFAQISDNITSVKKVISDARGKIPQFTRDIDMLGVFYLEVFDEINNLFDDPRETLGTIRSMFGFEGGIKASVINENSEITRDIDGVNNSRPNTTEIRKEENSNDDLINVITNAQALLNAYVNANLIDYQNDQDLLEVYNVLEDQFNFIIEDLDNSVGSVATQLYTLRDEFREFTNTTLVTIDKVITVNVQKTNMTSLVNRYYGNLDNFDAIIDLNNTLNPSEISGDIKILSE